MKMKHSALKVALACTAGLAISESTLAWDSGNDYSGQAPVEFHALMANTRECIGACPSAVSERWRYYQIFNQSTATPVIDTITDCKAVDASGNASNWATVVNSGYDPLSGRVFSDVPGPQGSGEECSIQSDPEGKAISHRSFALLPPSGPRPAALFYLEYGSGTRNVEVGVTNGNSSGSLNIDDITNALTDTVLDSGAAAAASAINGVTGLDSWVGSSIVNFFYLTCDTQYGGENCGSELAKSVPVPAFAAAALGLGLIGTTLVSNRRRAVKK